MGLGQWLDAHPEMGENEEHVGWLPDEATNVSYYKTYSWTAYEFDISEHGFKSWAIRWDLKEIEEEKSVRRYSYIPFRMREHEERMDFEEFFAEEEKHIATVAGGLYDEEDWDNGGGYHVVYDRKRRRAYFQSNKR